MHLWAFMGNDKLHKRAFSMEKRIAKLEQTAKPTEAKKLSAKFSSSDFYGDEVLVCHNVSKAFGDNGTGKSTLIKMIMQQETPDEGYIKFGPSVRPAYLPQIIHFSNEERSLLDTMLYDCRCQPQEARDRLAAFGFRGEDVFTPVGALSGGEKSRLRLCMLMGSDINLLILDEPTNHLDIASREWMEDAVSDYSEALLFVSHDRYFIEKFATRIWYLDGGKLLDYRGTYEQMREYLKRQEVFTRTAKAEAKAAKPDKSAKKSSPNKEKRIAKIERDIAALEKQVAALEEAEQEHASDYQKLMELSAEREGLENELLELYEQWEELNG